MTIIKTKLALAILFGSLCVSLPSFADKTKALDLKQPDAKAAYAMGADMGKVMASNLDSIKGTDIKLSPDIIIAAFIDGINNQSKLSDEDVKATMLAFKDRVMPILNAKKEAEKQAFAQQGIDNLKQGPAYLAQNKAKKGVKTLASGLQYTVAKSGTGNSPTRTDQVRVHYTGKLIDGTVFDSSKERGPTLLGVSRVIAGWTEALQLMKEGAKWQLTIPAELAYGKSGSRNIPGNSVLIFDIELLEVVPAKKD